MYKFYILIIILVLLLIFLLILLKEKKEYFNSADPLSRQALQGSTGYSITDRFSLSGSLRKTPDNILRDKTLESEFTKERIIPTNSGISDLKFEKPTKVLYIFKKYCSSRVLTKSGKCCPLGDLGYRPIVDSNDTCCYTNVLDNQLRCCDKQKLDANNNCLTTIEDNTLCKGNYRTFNGKCCPDNTIGLEENGTRCKINYAK
jgi:hypothetical protein